MVIMNAATITKPSKSTSSAHLSRCSSAWSSAFLECGPLRLDEVLQGAWPRFVDSMSSGQDLGALKTCHGNAIVGSWECYARMGKRNRLRQNAGTSGWM